MKHWISPAYPQEKKEKSWVTVDNFPVKNFIYNNRRRIK